MDACNGERQVQHRLQQLRQLLQELTSRAGRPRACEGKQSKATPPRYMTMLAFMAFPFSLEFPLPLNPFKRQVLLTCRVKKSVSSVASGSCTVCATRNAADHSSSISDGIASKICEVRQSQQFRQVMSSGRVAEQAAASCASPAVSESCTAALFS